MVSAPITNGNGHYANGNGNGYTNGNGHAASHAVPIVDPTSVNRGSDQVKVNSANVTYTEEHIQTKYNYHSTQVKVVDGKYEITPLNKEYEFRTERKVPKTG